PFPLGMNIGIVLRGKTWRCAMPDQTKGCADGSCSMQNAETRGPQIHYVPNVSVIYRGFLALYHSVTSKDGSRDAAIEELQNLIKIFNGLHDTEALTPEFMIKLCADFKEL